MTLRTLPLSLFIAFEFDCSLLLSRSFYLLMLVYFRPLSRLEGYAPGGCDSIML